MLQQLKQLDTFSQHNFLDENGRRCWQEYQNTTGASEQMLQTFEEKFGIALPATFKQLYRYKNGSSCMFELLYTTYYKNKVAPFYLLSLDEIEEEKQYFCDTDVLMAQMPDYYTPQAIATVDTQIKPYVSNRKWIPFAQMMNGSLYLLLDFDPAQGGHMGQIISYRHDPDYAYYLCDDITQLLADTQTNINSGYFEKFQQKDDH